MKYLMIAAMLIFSIDIKDNNSFKEKISFENDMYLEMDFPFKYTIQKIENEKIFNELLSPYYLIKTKKNTSIKINYIQENNFNNVIRKYKLINKNPKSYTNNDYMLYEFYDKKLKVYAIEIYKLYKRNNNYFILNYSIFCGIIKPKTFYKERRKRIKLSGLEIDMVSQSILRSTINYD